MFRFIMIHDRHRDIVGDMQPRAHFQRSFCAQVIFLVILVSYFIDTVHVIETA